MSIDVWLGGSERSHVHPEVLVPNPTGTPTLHRRGTRGCSARCQHACEFTGSRQEGEGEGRMVDEAIRTLTASRAGTQARCQHRSEAEFPNTRFTTLDCSVAQLGRLETRRGEEKRREMI